MITSRKTGHIKKDRLRENVNLCNIKNNIFRCNVLIIIKYNLIDIYL
jgi:hypothetical protein